MRVCVIGAGAAGLGCAYHLNKLSIDHVVYEQSDSVGGTWVYSEETDVHSSMYRDLRTNLPIEIMGYPGFPFPKRDKSFAHHSVVLDYFRNFYEENVAPSGNVSFNSKVTSVRREDSTWAVTCVVDGREKKTEFFTHVLVCNGKYSVPRVPEIDGVETFSGTIEHSHNYRQADAYRGKRVLIVGSGYSGIDIALEISIVADACFLSKRSRDPLRLPSRIVLKDNILRIRGSEVIFEGDSIEIDCIIYCTGYMISVPFLNDLVTVKEGYEVCDLYRQCLSIAQPTLALIGLPSFVIPCLVFDFQIRWVLAVFTGKWPLPSVDEMRKQCDENMTKRILCGRGDLKFTHNLRGIHLWNYLDTFASDGLGIVDPAIRRAYEATAAARTRSIENYRDELLLDIGASTISTQSFRPREETTLSESMGVECRMLFNELNKSKESNRRRAVLSRATLDRQS
ncbi:dimethylaniline monooxygenase [N-oxide-forming] 3 [Galendromus occidentalis]|uniref:Flavin-containing monooxygenase n=1 Tax=Galendromus occidentalis TaxID=34638 RepID=A0AAJ7L7S6_9ACAR|nr:dimethylaniline monooxygenase [N-oxide-forming] 3 [Galendromus occidentalis]